LDTYTEVALLSQYSAQPRLGHIKAVYHIFAYLDKHIESKIVFDPALPEVDELVFVDGGDWKDFYGNKEEELPPGMPEPLGRPMVMNVFVDADHAGNVVTRRSHTGIIIYLQNAPIMWFSKKQNTTESSTFGSEFVAMRIAKEMIIALRYKLRMFGIPIAGPANVFCDNMGVVKNTSIPTSTLNKKHASINYHTVREAVARGIMRVGKEDTMSNIADFFTKILSKDRRHWLMPRFMYRR